MAGEETLVTASLTLCCPQPHNLGHLRSLEFLGWFLVLWKPCMHVAQYDLSKRTF